MEKRSNKTLIHCPLCGLGLFEVLNCDLNYKCKKCGNTVTVISDGHVLTFIRNRRESSVEVL